MVDENLIQEAMGYLTEGHQEALDKLLETMNDEHSWYFMGYVAGYTEAVRHISLMQDDIDK